MKITDIRAAGLRGSTPKGGWTNELRPTDSNHTLIAVHTDEGLTGFGSVSNGGPVVQATLESLSRFYIGQSALDPERVSEGLRQNMFWFGRGGSADHTISGIDIALWDILGKAAGLPVSRLLGGRYRERVRPYASLLIEEPPVLKEEILRIKKEGFHAFKIGWGSFGRRDPRNDEAIVAAARQAIEEGDLLMVDAGGSDAFWSGRLKWALRTSDMLADYGVFWFEEPLSPDDIAGYKALRAASKLPIAGGEVLTRRQAFAPWLDGHAFDIVQPDVTHAGGISEMRRIAWMAEANGIRLIPHGWNTAVGLAADLQLASAFADTDLVEYLVGSPYIDEISAHPWRLDEDGYLTIPDGPGLGIDLDRDAVERYSGSAGFFG